jgi:predicted SnoaL-like aldol condensation-catalyzing enzyme
MSHKALVKKALTELFIKGDLTALDRYWSDQYVQHNPMIGNGHDALKGLMTSLGPNVRAEFGLMIEEGDFVMVHSRYTGVGPKPLIAVDIFRIQNDKLAEHWDVLQEEVPAEMTASRNPMFPIR